MEQMAHRERIEQHRRLKDKFFKRDAHSPLTVEQKQAFEGLPYYPYDPDLRFFLEVEPFTQQDSISMQTSTGEPVTYVRYGRISFSVAGEPLSLTLYAARVAEGYFVPFADQTSGEETYGGGRYLDLKPLADGRLEVDFNLAYHPYCVYNANWRCPIPPAENRLPAAIRAGEKLPSGGWYTQH